MIASREHHCIPTTHYQCSQNVLYFGDHVFSDLIDPTVEQGWRTGAIIHELDAEIQTRNTASYRHTLAWLIRIENLINEAQTYYGHEETDGLYSLINEWREQRRQARHELRNVFNSAFGSVFRTYHNPTYFAGKIRQVKINWRHHRVSGASANYNTT